MHRPIICKPADDGHLWMWIYPWISTENLWIWIWIWMNNFISTASLVSPLMTRCCCCCCCCYYYCEATQQGDCRSLEHNGLSLIAFSISLAKKTRSRKKGSLCKSNGFASFSQRSLHVQRHTISFRLTVTYWSTMHVQRIRDFFDNALYKSTFDLI